MIFTRRFLAVAALAMTALTGTSIIGAAHAYWERGSSGTNYEYTPRGHYNGNWSSH